MRLTCGYSHRLLINVDEKYQLRRILLPRTTVNSIGCCENGGDRWRRTRHTHRRVKFDFEVDFSNGGGLQGQGFRLDIEGEDISDEQLARYIVEDMRLLMVQEVRILDKEIITERHKRVEDPS
jgi:hypothetical protein